jgi:hypothetical protein
LQDPEFRPTAREVLEELKRIDPSTKPNNPVVLYPEMYSLTATFKMVDILTKAIPQNTKVLDVSAAAEEHIRNSSVQDMIRLHGISDLEAQSIFVYTASQGFAVCPTHGAPFSSYNTALREAQSDRVSAWCDYSFLLYNALLKLPSVACTVYRGLDVPLLEVSHLYFINNFVWFRSPTSTTTDKDNTMRQFGQGANAGVGTFMELRVKNAKEIETFSAVPGERERLIPHNTCFRVLQALSAKAANDLKEFGTFPPNVDLVVVEEVFFTECKLNHVHFSSLFR